MVVFYFNYMNAKLIGHLLYLDLISCPYSSLISHILEWMENLLFD